MRARAAYISSLGTTGILVSSALMMLTMVSALVAFRGWPDNSPGGGVQAIPLQSPHPSALVSVAHPVTHSRVVRTTPLATKQIAAAAASIGRTASTARLRKDVPARGPAIVGDAPAMRPAPTASQGSPGHAGGSKQPPPAQDGPPIPTDPPSAPQTLPAPPSPPDPRSTVGSVTGLLGGPTPPGMAVVIELLP
jgi:hypothetical protein